ncbi:MAG: hypothetical protein NTW06_02790 [Candidatus Falkowbacteria bacterium]|nr:hypothetical protein [Candidatus Falkowbacteria bacterium]
MIEKMDRKKYKYFAKAVLMVSLIFLTVPFFCYAIEWKDVVDVIMGGIASLIVSALGAISGVVIASIISIATYNNFINQEEIVTAWQIVRDFSNMWFILILLLIAFATILRIETYSMKRWLPKLLIMAVLINFSKTICGIMIDFSQVIMLTFVNTFATNGSNFVSTLQMQNFISAVQAAKSETITMGNATVAYLLACIFMLVAVVTLLAILIVFLMRLIMLWILIALSPLAFMLSSFPQGQRYASQYWGEFTKYLINGPVLAFFLWLALSVLGNINAGSITSSTAVQGLTTGVVQILHLENFISFILAIGFLVGGMMISQQIGGIGAGWGMRTVRNLQSRGVNIARRTATAPIRGVVGGTKALAGFGLDKLHQTTGVDLNLKRVWTGVKEKRTEKKRERYAEGMQVAADVMREKGGRFYGALAMTGTPGTAWETVTSMKGLKQRFTGGRRMAKNKAEIAPELEQARYDQDFIAMSKKDRKEENKKTTMRRISLDSDIDAETDEGKKAKLIETRDVLNRKMEFARKNEEKDFSEAEIKAKTLQVQTLQAEMNKNIPLYDFEARAAEQCAVSAKMSKKRDISDGNNMAEIRKKWR